MQNRTKSFWGGAAVAALLVTAGGADAGQDRSWVQQPAQTFDARALTLDHVIADVTVTVKDSGPATVAVQGPRYLVNEVHARAGNGMLTITGPDHDADHNVNVWDWSKWFDYSDVHEGSLRVTVAVPRGSDVNARHMIGDLTVGDVMSHLYIETISGDVKVGRVTDAKLKVVGGGDISVSSVQQSLQLDIAGSGDVKVGSIGGSAAVTVAGSGDTSLTNVGGGLNANIAGSGDMVVGNVNGPVTISMAGSGDAKIAGGKADPLKVSMVGGGDFSFGGVAVNPSISSIGAGDVWINAYSGHLSSSGMAEVHIGANRGDDDDDDGHHMHVPPAPPAPAAPPAPPAPPSHHHGG